MRRIIWIFVVISPLIALAQNDAGAIPGVASGMHLAQQAATSASYSLTHAVHALQTLLT